MCSDVLGHFLTLVFFFSAWSSSSLTVSNNYNVFLSISCNFKTNLTQDWIFSYGYLKNKWFIKNIQIGTRVFGGNTTGCLPEQVFHPQNISSVGLFSKKIGYVACIHTHTHCPWYGIWKHWQSTSYCTNECNITNA